MFTDSKLKKILNWQIMVNTIKTHRQPQNKELKKCYSLIAFSILMLNF